MFLFYSLYYHFKKCVMFHPNTLTDFQLINHLYSNQNYFLTFVHFKITLHYYLRVYLKIVLFIPDYYYITIKIKSNNSD